MKRANFHHQQRLFQDVFQGPAWNGGDLGVTLLGMAIEIPA